jgi:hypothetical protein
MTRQPILAGLGIFAGSLLADLIETGRVGADDLSEATAASLALALVATTFGKLLRSA